MGFLKNIIRRVIGEGIGEGISGGISKAVEDSVRKAVQPAADRWAQKQAENIDQMSKAADELQASQAAYAQAMSNAAQELNQAAAQVKAGSANVNAADFSHFRLSKEQYAAAVKATFASDPAALQDFRQKLPGFPIWCFGGSDISVDEYGRTDAGEPYYSLTVHNTSLNALLAYAALLKQCGFTCLNAGDENVLRKTLPNGEYLFFSMYEAMSDDTSFSAALYRTKDPAGR